jgi:integrase/recombinase XerD
MNDKHRTETKQESFQSAVPRAIFRAVVESFLIYCRVERQYAPESQAKIEECFDSWLLKQFGAMELGSLRQMHVLQFRQSLEQRALSVARQYSLLMTLKLFLKFCREVMEIPCLDPGAIRLPRREIPKVEYLTNPEIQAIRDSIDSNHIMGLRLRTIVETLLATGMRISELLSLNRGSIRRELGQAVIMGKGGKQRTIFFSEECLRWIDRYVGARRDTNEAMFVTSGENPRRLKRGDVPRFFKALARAAGIEKHLTPHLLRHTFCTNLRNNGADISLIKELAGHRDIETTARYYLGTDTQVLKDAVSRYLDYSN